jgi:hypothetical protein
VVSEAGVFFGRVVQGRVTQVLMWVAVGAMLLASILVVIVTRSNSRDERP